MREELREICWQNTGVTLKAYNKVLETMQQGTVRGRDVDCKFDKLPNPSTQGLKNKLYDDKYSQNGITREEITFHFDNGTIHDWDSMKKKY